VMVRSMRWWVVLEISSWAEGAYWQAASDSLAHCGKIRLDSRQLLVAAFCDAEPGHYFIENQQGTRGAAQLPELFVESRFWEIQAGVCGYGFDDNGCEVTAKLFEGLREDLLIVVRKRYRQLCELWRNSSAVGISVSQRTAPGLYKQRIHVPMIASLEFYDEFSVSKSAGQPDARHGGLCAAVYHSHFLK